MEKLAQVQAKLECLKIAATVAKSKEELVSIAEELAKFIFDLNKQ